MSSKGTSREHCIQGKEHGNAYRQREIYDLLQERGPMLAKDIAKEVGLGRDSARSVIQKLQRDGYVETRPDLEFPSRNLYRVVKDE